MLLTRSQQRKLFKPLKIGIQAIKDLHRIQGESMIFGEASYVGEYRIRKIKKAVDLYAIQGTRAMFTYNLRKSLDEYFDFLAYSESIKRDQVMPSLMAIQAKLVEDTRYKTYGSDTQL